MSPFFSIIIPTYNRAQLITKSIESVLKQTFSDWELIIVDDGSTDGTEKVIQSYTDVRIKYIYQQNAERSAARNNGIKNAQGKYICFLDSDDYFLLNRLELLYKALEKFEFPIAAYYTGVQTEKNGIRTAKNPQELSANIFDQIVSSSIHSQQICIHSSIIQQIKYDNRFRIGEDMELWLRIADKFPLVYLDNQQTVVVVDQEERSVNVKRNNVYLEYSRTLRHVFSKSHTGNKISRTLKRKMISDCYFGIAKYFIYNNKKWDAVKNLSLAIISDFSHFQTKYRIRIILMLLSINGVEKAQQFIV